MDNVLYFVENYWGLITATIIIIIYARMDWTGFKAKVKNLIFVAEERARQYSLETGEEKMQWVLVNGYKYVPVWAKLFITETAFRAIVQAVFDSIVNWAEKQAVR